MIITVEDDCVNKFHDELLLMIGINDTRVFIKGVWALHIKSDSIT